MINDLVLKYGNIKAQYRTCRTGFIFNSILLNSQCNQVKLALDTCVSLHQWNMAVELSRKIDIPEITTRLISHAERLLELGKVSDTIELFRNAGCYKDAANLLFQVKEHLMFS